MYMGSEIQKVNWMQRAFCFTRDNLTTLSVVGYDIHQAKSLELYRLVMISTQKWVCNNQMIFNAS